MSLCSETDRLTESITAGCTYLLRLQRVSGNWEEYELPTGRSDAWVTAYVGLALARVALRRGFEPAYSAAARAAKWLSSHRPYPAGWGYNAVTGPDADSTGYALALLRAAGQTTLSNDEDWLLTRWQPEGGFATFDGPGGWGKAHPDVTPVAFAALSRTTREHLGPWLRQALFASRDIDGTWPAYWWRTRHYSTYLNSCLARAVGPHFLPSAPVVTLQDNRAIHSVFDLVFVTANAALHDSGNGKSRELADILIAQQSGSGFWPGGANLRVTRHDTPDPWNAPEGECYVDFDHLITTASAVALLSCLEERWTQAK